MQFILLALASLAAAGPAIENRQAPPSYGQERPAAPPAYGPPATFATRPSVAPTAPSYGQPESRPVASYPEVRTSTVFVTRTQTVEGRPSACPTISASAGVTITVTSFLPRPTDGGNNGGDDDNNDDDNDDGDDNEIPPVAQPINPCSDLFTPRCCQVGLLDLASLTCNSVPDPITSLDNFDAQCAETGATAQCCLLPVLGQGLICSNP